MPAASDPSSRLKEAFAKAVASISRDMPVLMHGSGDVSPSEVNPATAELLSALTAQYIGTLVDAAIDSHDMLRDSQPDLPLVPPPCFSRSRKPPIPPAPPDTTGNSSSSYRKQRKRKRATDEFWDDPLPEPKIRGITPAKKKGGDNDDEVHVDEWVGAAGVDMVESRARSAFVRGNAALSTQSFIFPICHDVYAYGRVTEVQAASRVVAPLLLDPVLMNMVRTEGKLKHAALPSKKKATTGNTSDPEDDVEENADDDEEEELSAWPGIESLLPVHAYATMDDW
jgi:hypothetical protein